MTERPKLAEIIARDCELAATLAGAGSRALTRTMAGHGAAGLPPEHPEVQGTKGVAPTSDALRRAHEAARRTATVFGDAAGGGVAPWAWVEAAQRLESLRDAIRAYGRAMRRCGGECAGVAMDAARHGFATPGNLGMLRRAVEEASASAEDLAILPTPGSDRYGAWMRATLDGLEAECGNPELWRENLVMLRAAADMAEAW